MTNLLSLGGNSLAIPGREYAEVSCHSQRAFFSLSGLSLMWPWMTK